MCKQKNKTRLEKSQHPIHKLKRSVILIIAAFMIGISNVIYEEDKMANGNQNYIEQEQEKD